MSAATRDDVIAAVLKATETDPWLAKHPPRVEWFSGQFAPPEIDTDHELISVMSAAHRAVTGEMPAIRGITAGTDARHFVTIGNIPALLYGAGEVMWAHAPNESIGIDELMVCAKAVAVAAFEWCS